MGRKEEWGGGEEGLYASFLSQKYQYLYKDEKLFLFFFSTSHFTGLKKKKVWGFTINFVAPPPPPLCPKNFILTCGGSAG
jgi:hypothetical protein